LSLPAASTIGFGAPTRLGSRTGAAFGCARCADAPAGPCGIALVVVRQHHQRIEIRLGLTNAGAQAIAVLRVVHVLRPDHDEP
jgi:hypothetical protein